MAGHSDGIERLDALPPEIVIKANVLFARTMLQRSGLSDNEIDELLHGLFAGEGGLSLSEIAAEPYTIDLLRKGLAQACRVPALAGLVEEAINNAETLPHLTGGDGRSVIVKGLFAIALALAVRVESVTGEGITFYEGLPIDLVQLEQTVGSIVDGALRETLKLGLDETAASPLGGLLPAAGAGSDEGKYGSPIHAAADGDGATSGTFHAPAVVTNTLPEPRQEVILKRNFIWHDILNGKLDIPYIDEPRKVFRGRIPNKFNEQDPPFRVGIGLAYSGDADGGFRIAIRLQTEAEIKQTCWKQLESFFEKRAGNRVHMKRTRPVILQVRRRQRFKDHHRPLIMGSSLSAAQGPHSTLGCFVKRRNVDGPAMILGSGHALSNSGQTGLYSAIFQPATGADIEDLENRVAVLDEHCLPLALDEETAEDRLDYALAPLIEGIEHEPTLIKDIGTLAGSAELDFHPQSPTPAVQKWSVFSGRTEGNATAERLLQPAFDPSTGRIVHLIDVFEIRGKGDNVLFSGDGDSGALVLDASRRGVGIINAGTDRREKKHAGRTYATPLSLILQRSNLELV